MNTDKTSLSEPMERYVPLTTLAKIYGFSVNSLKQIMHLAKRKGVPMPERRRVKRFYYYDRQLFNLWLWEHSHVLHGQFEREKGDVQC